MKALRLSWLVAATVLAPCSLTAQGITGRVVEAGAESPVAGALVSLVDSLSIEISRVLSDSTGAFAVEAPAHGWFRLRATRIGFATTTTDEFQLRRNETLQVQLRMAHDAIPLEPLTVTGRSTRRPTRLEASGFHERMRTGQGFFMQREDIEATNARDMAEMLRRAPGIRLDRNTRAHGPTVRIQRGNCLPAVYLDGLYLGEGAEEIYNQPSIDADAVEVYTSPIRVPVAYRQRRGHCGAVLIWTRDR